MSNFKGVPIKQVYEHFLRVRDISLTKGMQTLESTTFRSKSVAERARMAQIEREEKQDEWK